MMNDQIKTLVETTIQTQILQAFKDAPEAIDALVQAALEQPVNQYGQKPDAYAREAMPYLTWLVGDTIRQIARVAVVQTVEERRTEIETAVRSAVQAESLVQAMVQKVLGALDTDHKVQITFTDERQKDRY